MSGKTRTLRSDLAALAAAWAVAIPLITLVRHPAAETHRLVKETSDVYVLPPPAAVVRLSLGHRAAMADYLWAGVLVEQGLHSVSKRRYENLFKQIEAINELDPTFREPYLVVEALTVFLAKGATEDDIRQARVVLERGVHNLPNDPEILIAAGSFIGLMAPSSYLSDPEEKARWKLDGAEYLARAAELGGDKNQFGWQALSGFGLLRKAGKNRQAITFLQNALAGTDDEELRAHIKALMDKMAQNEDAFDQAEQRRAFAAFRKRQDQFDEIWRTAYPLASKTGVLVMGPPYDAAFCSGGTQRTSPRCAFTWAQWAAEATDDSHAR
ncbi:MAG: hypothetical protein IPK82_11815 [Polyangiaceae bacterium]|nr:hypothetical protein [Polyangiaceae bacterium]